MTKPMLYLTYAFYLERLREDTGLKEKLTSYCFCQGLVNAINSRCPKISPLYLTNSLGRCYI
jgi:hypothetical protein